MLNLKVFNQNIMIEDETKLVSNTSGEYECHFDFDESWEGYTKTAIFLNINKKNIKSCNDNEIIQPVLLVDNNCVIPVQALRPDSNLKIGVFGTKGDKQRPTIYTPNLYVRLGAVPNGTIPAPDPNIYLQILQIMEDTKQIAQSVRDDADAGKFDGVGVPRGGEAGQVLTKTGSGDFNTAWKNLGDATDKTYEHNQLIPSEVWSVEHGLNKYPSITVVDSAGTVVVGEIQYIDKNNVKLVFSDKFSGRAYFN